MQCSWCYVTPLWPQTVLREVRLRFFDLRLEVFDWTTGAGWAGLGFTGAGPLLGARARLIGTWAGPCATVLGATSTGFGGLRAGLLARDERDTGFFSGASPESRLSSSV